MDWLKVFWCWLNENSGAVQGSSAVVSVLVTGILVAITWRYVQLTNKLAKSAQSQFEVSQAQFKLGQEQFALSQKQFIASYVPQLKLAVFVTDFNPQLVVYQYANVGKQPLTVKSLSVVIEYGAEVFEHKDSAVVGYVLPPTSPDRTLRESSFVMPEAVWSVLRTEQPEKLKTFLTVNLAVSDVAGLLTYQCSMSPGKGYKVEVVG